MHFNLLACLEVVGSSSLSSIPTRVLIVLSEVVLVMLRKRGLWLLFIDPVIMSSGLLTADVLHVIFAISSLAESGLTNARLVGLQSLSDDVAELVGLPALVGVRLILISVEHGRMFHVGLVLRAVVFCDNLGGVAVVVEELVVNHLHLGHC